MHNSRISKIIESDLCLGCGFCEAVAGKESAKMKLNSQGFFQPDIQFLDAKTEKDIETICPGINHSNHSTLAKNERIWGKIIGLYEGYSTDKEVRTKGSSGGIVSALAIHLLETKRVNAILQVGGDINDYEKNTLKVSKTREQVILNSSSRYAPALVFDKIIEILEETNDVFGFIGKPCDIAALKNFLKVCPIYKNRFIVTISIICAGMPAFSGTKALINEFSPALPVKDLIYRGNGWPGYFSFTDNKNRSFTKSYNDSWGKVLNRHLHFRCKICPEGIGMLADLAIGDAWETKNGYPDFTEKEGRSLVIARTEIGQELLADAQSSNSIVFNSLEIEKLKLMQPFQYNRRKSVGARVIAAQLAKGKFLNFKNQYIYKNLLTVSPILAFKEFYGTYKRAK